MILTYTMVGECRETMVLGRRVEYMLEIEVETGVWGRRGCGVEGRGEEQLEGGCKEGIAEVLATYMVSGNVQR
jgi:hypothetical protein